KRRAGEGKSDSDKGAVQDHVVLQAVTRSSRHEITQSWRLGVGASRIPYRFYLASEQVELAGNGLFQLHADVVVALRDDVQSMLCRECFDVAVRMGKAAAGANLNVACGGGLDRKGHAA